MARESEEEILLTVKELMRKQIPHSLQLEPQEVSQAIQVLTPMHRGLLGTINLNREMQSLLNPVGEALERGGSVLRLGDKVMQLRNNYDKGVFNGDLGRIASIDREEGSIKVDFTTSWWNTNPTRWTRSTLPTRHRFTKAREASTRLWLFHSTPRTTCCFTAAFSTRR